jgi:phytol kinase
MRVEAGAALASALYFAAVLGVAEAGRRRFRLPADVTRKAALGALGLWSIPAVHLFEDSREAALAFLGLAAVLYLSFRFELLAAVEDEGPGLGSVLTPFTAALLLGLFPRELAYVAVCGIVATALGDGAAALVGRRLGTRRYRVLGHARTMEGTLAHFLAASAASAPVLAILGGLDPHQAVAFALIAGTLGAVVEMLSVYGTDNVTVPVTVALTLLALVRASGAQ